MFEFFPGLEQAFDYAKSKAGLTLLTRYQTPEAIRRADQHRLTTWLRNHGVRSSRSIAQKAVAAAKKQHTTVSGQDAGARIVTKLETDILRLHNAFDELDPHIESRFQSHTDAEI